MVGAVGTVLQTSILLTAACVITSASMGGGVGRIPQRGGEYRIDRGGRDSNPQVISRRLVSIAMASTAQYFNFIAIS